MCLSKVSRFYCTKVSARTDVQKLKINAIIKLLSCSKLYTTVDCYCRSKHYFLFFNAFILIEYVMFVCVSFIHNKNHKQNLKKNRFLAKKS